MLGALAGPAGAADLPLNAPVTKAPVMALWDTGGWYVSLNTGAEVAQAKVSGSATFVGAFASGNVQANGGVIGAGIGFMRGNPASWYGGECNVYYRNISAGVNTMAGSAGVASRWEGSCGVRIGFDPAMVSEALSGLGLSGIGFPTITPIPPPGVKVASTTRTFVEAGGSLTGVSGDFGTAGGATVAWGPYFKLGTLFQPINAITGKPSGGVFEVSVRAALYDKGFEFQNFLDPNHNVVFAGQSHLTRAYMAELSYKFAPGGAVGVLAAR
jgi:hypothetical protein